MGAGGTPIPAVANPGLRAGTLRDHEEFIAYLREQKEIGPSRHDRVTVIT
ncbi:hypothetical protein ACIBI9_49095 [Nonomuraea sp. NPDC050451]